MYNIRLHVLLDLKTVTFGWRSYIWYNTAAHVVNYPRTDEQFFLTNFICSSVQLLQFKSDWIYLHYDTLSNKFLNKWINFKIK